MTAAPLPNQRTYNEGMKRAVLLLLLSLPLQPATSRFDRLPIRKKIELIENGKVPPGTQLVFAQKELNEFLPEKAREIAPGGLREPRVEIGDGSVTGYATVDFVKMRHAQGDDLNWLMTQICYHAGMDGEFEKYAAKYTELLPIFRDSLAGKRRDGSFSSAIDLPESIKQNRTVTTVATRYAVIVAKQLQELQGVKG